jgi:hypothetical protein
MSPEDLKIINIKTDFNNYQTHWNTCLDYIRLECINDQLYENYLSINLDKFVCFIVVLYQDEIISFGGVEQRPDRWGSGVARALTRFWISPKHRTQSLTKWRDDSIKFSPIVLKAQMDFVNTQSDIVCVIITREGNYRRSFEEIVRLANTVDRFELQPNRYNVCECMNIVPEACQQFVATNNVEHFKAMQAQGYFQELS